MQPRMKPILHVIIAVFTISSSKQTPEVPTWESGRAAHLSVHGAALLHDGVKPRRLVGVLAPGRARRSGCARLVSAR